MARKFLYFVAILIVLVIAALLVLRIWPAELARFAFVPRGGFEAQGALPPGAYADGGMWLSRPGMRDDPAQYLPDGAAAGPRGSAYVFFVHPTSYLARDHWNAPLADWDSTHRASLFVRGMASAFNAEAGVFVPRYRQAAFGAFLVNRPETQRALTLAYGDVLQAFDAFVAQVPRDAPIVLAGHSQGARHVLRLLKDRVRGTPLARRIVAAYIVGWPVSVAHDLPATGLSACVRPDQADCAMSWLSFAEPAESGLVTEAMQQEPGLDGKPKGAGLLCTNPLTGGATPVAPASANLGTLVPARDLRSGKLVPGAVPARCDPQTGLLMLGDPPDLGPYVLPGNNYHIYDIPLFWANLRADVARREAAWRAGAR